MLKEALKKKRIRLMEEKIKKAQRAGLDYVTVPKIFREMTWREKLTFLICWAPVREMTFDEYRKWCEDGKKC